MKNPRSFGTHDGTFHADEVTACALLLQFDLIDEDKIFRTRDKDVLAACEYVCDVGGIYDPAQKLFDHHQLDYQGPLSSAGMTLMQLKDLGVINQKEYDFFNDMLIIGVDAHDNGKDLQPPGHCSYSHVIANFVPITYDPSPERQDQAFFEALAFAKGHLSRLWNRYNYVQSCKEVVREAMEKYKDCLIFQKGIPWQELFFELGGVNHPATFIIMPSGDHWNLRGIPPSYDDRMSVRIPLPEEWAGHLEDDLENVCGIEGAVFCHKGRFVSVWETKEAALKALEYTLKNEGKSS